MKSLFHLYAVNRDGFRVTPTETERDRQRAARTVVARNDSTWVPGRARWVAVEIDASSGRMIGPLNPTLA